MTLAPETEAAAGIAMPEATPEVALKPGSFASPPRQSKPTPQRFSDLYNAGFAVFPLRARSKEPGAKWDQYRDERRATAADAVEWDATDKNVAVITGAPSGIFVLDLDGPDAEQTAHDKGWVADTYTVATGRGKHLYYQLPGFAVRNGAGKLAEHVDVRGDGGYVVGAGSVHPNGQRYELLSAGVGPAVPPPALVDALRPTPRERRQSDARPTNHGGGEFAQLLHEFRNLTEGSRNSELNRIAFRVGQMIAAGLVDPDEGEDQLREAAIDVGLENREIDHILPRVIEEGMNSPRNSDGEEPISQIVMARVYADRHGSKRRHDHTSGKWMHVDRVSGIWKPDDRRATFNEIGSIVHEIGGGVARYSNAGFISGTETIARGLPAIAVTQELFDADKMILGTPAGPVDLRTGRLMPPNPALLLSRSTSVVPTAGEPVQWLRFLAQSTGGDADMIAFLQRAVGYMLTGLTIEQALFFVYGDGGNGKGVFINVVRRILADYAVTSAMDTFTASKHEQHSTNLAMLRGARLVTASETEKGKAWAEARIKQLTGSDEISARFMRQDNFSFVPEFKLLIIGNFHPVLNTVDDAMRRRFNIIPFNRKPDAPNPSLEQELEVEFPRILAWMIEGCLEWQRDGLKRPAAVVEATAEYFDDQDLFGQWIEEFCECGRGYTATSQELFHNWSLFASDMNEDAGSIKGFGALMTKRGFKPGRASSGSRARLWEGVRLQKVHDDRSGGWIAKTAHNSSLRAM